MKKEKTNKNKKTEKQRVIERYEILQKAKKLKAKITDCFHLWNFFTFQKRQNVFNTNIN